MARGKYGGVGYDTDIDYQAQINKAVEMGDYAYAATLEKMRNAKIQGEGLNYEVTNNFSQFAQPSKQAEPAKKIEGIMSQISGMNFKYDANKDPLFKQIKDNYKSTVGNVTENVLGSYSGMTGGRPSSYAVSAAATAGANHMQKADDVIPELYQLAYSKYADDKADLYKQYGIMQELEQKEYERKLYEDEAAYAKQQAALKAEADATKAQLDYEKWLAEYGLDATKIENDAQNQQQKYWVGVVMDLIENGTAPQDYMLKNAGFEGVTGQQLLNDYIAESNRSIAEKNKYKGTTTGKKADELKRPTSAMFDAIDKLFAEDGEGIKGFEKLKGRYDWDVYDEGEFDRYVEEYYGDESGVDVYLRNERKRNGEETISDKALDIAYTLNRDARAGVVKIGKNGKYSVDDEYVYDVVKAIYENPSLTSKEAEELIYDYYGITEEQVSKLTQKK